MGEVTGRLGRFFDELPSACLAYAIAVGSLGVAAIVVRIAIHAWTGA